MSRCRSSISGSCGSNGDVTDVEVAGTLLDRDQRSIQVIVRDISARRHTEAALRESEERLALAFAGAQEGVWDWNLETGAVVYSTRWKEMLGYADDEIEPHVSAWERLLHPEDFARAEQARVHVTRGGHDVRRRVPSAPQGRPLSARALARAADSRRPARRGPAHCRHPLRPQRTQAGGKRAARESGTARARVRRRAGRRVGLESRDRCRRVLAALERDAGLRAKMKSSRT